MMPPAIYVWLVPSEHVQEQPGSWRIRKWDTEPFPEANFTVAQRPEEARTMAEALMRDCIGLRYFDQAIGCTQGTFPTVAAHLREWLDHAKSDLYGPSRDAAPQRSEEEK